MGKNTQAPPAPDMTPIANASKKASRLSFRLGKKQFEWAKKQGKQNHRLTKNVVHDLRNIMRTQTANAKEDRARYESVFIPLQDEYIKRTNDFRNDVDAYGAKVDSFSASVAKLKQEATDYGSEANKTFRMGRAQAAVADQFEAARNNNIRQLEDHGINPSSTRYQALDIGVRTAEAAAKASAGTEAGLQTEDTQRAMYKEALDRELQARGLDTTVLGLKANAQSMDAGMINVGQGFPAQIATQVGQAIGAGNSAVSNTTNTSQVAAGNRTSINSFLNTTGNLLSGWATALNQNYSNQVQAFSAESQASSGIGGILGGVAGIVKSFFDEGGEVPEVLSPSMGAIPDDVDAKLTAGEFVIPAAAASYYGTRHLQQLVDKAHTEMGIPEAV